MVRINRLITITGFWCHSPGNVTYAWVMCITECFISLIFSVPSMLVLRKSRFVSATIAPISGGIVPVYVKRQQSGQMASDWFTHYQLPGNVTP